MGAAPTTSSFSTKHLALVDWGKGTVVLGFVLPCVRGSTVH